MDDSKERYSLVFVSRIGTDNAGLNIYNFLFSASPDMVMAEGWGEVPACNISIEELSPDMGAVDFVKECHTEMDLQLAQDNCCFSMQDARDGIVALAYEDINGYDEYPEPIRIVLSYGEDMESVVGKFEKRDIELPFVE